MARYGKIFISRVVEEKKAKNLIKCKLLLLINAFIYVECCYARVLRDYGVAGSFQQHERREALAQGGAGKRNIAAQNRRLCVNQIMVLFTKHCDGLKFL